MKRNLKGLIKFAQKTHTVADKETLGEIAAKYGVTVGDIAAANNISDVNKIRVGQTFIIPEKLNLPTEGPLGYRQNNPGNLRSDGKTLWEGAIGVPTADDFLTFYDPYAGFRAMARVLFNYGHRHKIDTIEKAIERYAPEKENSTGEYSADVISKLGLKPGGKVDLTNEDFLQRLIPVMAENEIGPEWFGKYDRTSVSNAVSNAVSSK